MGAVSAVCGLFTGKVIFRSWSLVITLNCILGGLVAITASCSIVQPWAAFLIGTVAAWIYICGRMLLGFAHIDDPVDASRARHVRRVGCHRCRHFRRQGSHGGRLRRGQALWMDLRWHRCAVRHSADRRLMHHLVVSVLGRVAL